MSHVDSKKHSVGNLAGIILYHRLEEPKNRTTSCSTISCKASNSCCNEYTTDRQSLHPVFLGVLRSSFVHLQN